MSLILGSFSQHIGQKFDFPTLEFDASKFLKARFSPYVLRTLRLGRNFRSLLFFGLTPLTGREMSHCHHVCCTWSRVEMYFKAWKIEISNVVARMLSSRAAGILSFSKDFKNERGVKIISPTKPQLQGHYVVVFGSLFLKKRCVRYRNYPRKIPL